MSNYFNSLNKSEKKSQLSKCRFMNIDEFQNENNILKEKNIVIVGCGAQGLNQGLNMRDSGLNISYALRDSAISSKRKSFINASSNNFKIGSFDELIPNADMVINLTPDKNHNDFFLSSSVKFRIQKLRFIKLLERFPWPLYYLYTSDTTPEIC